MVSQESMEFHQKVEARRRSDDYFYRLLRATQEAQENEKQPLSSEDWVHVVNAKGDYTPTAIEESIQNGYVTIDEEQRVRLTGKGAKWLSDFKERN